MTNQPLISVIMGVYNCESTLFEALQCIANQTYDHWEIIICDDSSKDNTFMVAKKFADLYPKKVLLLQNESNMGLNYTLNECLKHASGELIARMDGDDLCHPKRFEKELAALIEHPSISIVSSNMELFDDKGVWGKTHVEEFPTCKSFIRETPFCHAPCLVLKDAFDAVDGYSVSKRLLRVEDYHLWAKMYEKGFRGMNLLEPLYQMRDDRNAQRRRKLRFRINEAYVKVYAISHLKLPFFSYVYCLRPILIGLLPGFIYKFLHRSRASSA